MRIAVTLAGKRLARRNACPTRRSNSSRSTRSARCRWTRCRRRRSAIRARRWRSRRSRTCSTREVMRHNPASPHWPNRDRFILSAGHACVLQYSTLHLVGLQPLARGAEALPPVAVGDAGPSGVPPHRRRRGDDGAARAGVRERRRHGLRRALPRRHVQPAAPRDRRPPRLRDLLRRRPDGGRLVRGGVARRHERARQAHLLLRRQPHHDRRHDVDLVHRGSRAALRGARLARAVGRRRRTTSTRCATRSRTRRPRRRKPSMVDRPLAHRLRRAEGGRHGEVARLAARRGQRSRRRSGRSAGIPTSTSTCPTRSTST